MCDADHCQCAIGAAACKTCGTRMQAGEKVTVTPKQVFVKVILPKWLNELYSLLRPVAPNAGDVVDSTAEGTAGSAAAGEAANEPPRKKLKSKGEYKQLAQERRVALAGLTSELFKTCDIREHASRGSAQAPFKWFQTATTKLRCHSTVAESRPRRQVCPLPHREQQTSANHRVRCHSYSAVPMTS